jgi:hypothetical protein
VTTSSQPQGYLTTSNDVGVIAQDIRVISDDIISIDLSSIGTDTITLTGSYNTSYGYSTMTTSTGMSNTVIGGVGISSITLNDISATSFTWKSPEEWVDCFPDYDRIQKMCDTYPGLKIAFEKFKTTYKLVKDDYDTPKDKRKTP